jgi:hypothetical protein
MPAGTVSYVTPVSGATGPTVAQSSQVNEVIADIAFADGNTVANIVHNLGLSAAGADGRPRISAYTKVSGAALNNVAIAVVDANTVSVTPTLTSVGTGLTVRVSCQRPHSITR